MSNQRADRNIDDLPDFLADPTAAASEAEHEGESVEPGEEQAQEPGADDEPQTADPAPSQPTHRSDRSDRHGHRPKGTTGLAAASILCLVAAGALGYAQSQGKLTELRDFGGTPATLVVAGIVCVVGASVRRHGAVDQTRLAAQLESEAAAGNELRESLAYLVSAQQAQAQRPPAAGEELQRVLLTLERHDEKINNLTKAMKMYGKPLMEIANQVADIGASVTSTKSDVESVLEVTRTGFTHIESTFEEQDFRKVLESVHQQLKRADEQMQKAVAGLGERMPRPDALPQLAERLETQVQKAVAGLGERMPRPDALPQLAERLETQVRSLGQRLEDSSREQTKAIEKIARHDAAAANEKMTQQLEAAIQRLRADLEPKKGGNNLDSLESSVREIQREVSGLATATSQIQNTLRSGGGRAAAAPAQPAQPAASQPVASDDSNASSDAKAGASQNRTGTRAASGKNVLGAIAKLKQMKH